MTAARQPPGWYVVSLRPRGQHAALRRAAARHGAGLIALSPWRLQDRDDDLTRAALRRALAAPRVLFTSPAAVRAAARLQPLRPPAGAQWCAVGAGSAAALRRAGAGRVIAPARMDSEGLLGLPMLQELAGTAVGLVSAPGGRGVLAPALQARGAEVRRADVYERIALPSAARTLATLRALTRPALLLVSSGEALQLVLGAVPDEIAARLRAMPVVAASARLAELAAAHGFARSTVATSARPRDLLAAARVALADLTVAPGAIR